jgi:hypothetical protein
MADSSLALAASSAATLLRRVQLCADNGESFIEFSGVSPSDFEDFYQLLDGRGRITYFGGASGVLFVKMPKLQHEAVTMTVMDIAQRQIPTMGARGSDIMRVGATRHDSMHELAGSKEADDGIMLMDKLLAGATFPSFVLEVAYTQSLAAARKAKDWWFQNSAPGHPWGEVRNVLIAKIGDDKLGNIDFEVWRRGAPRPKKASIQLKRSSEQQLVEMQNPDH